MWGKLEQNAVDGNNNRFDGWELFECLGDLGTGAVLKTSRGAGRDERLTEVHLGHSPIDSELFDRHALINRGEETG